MTRKRPVSIRSQDPFSDSFATMREDVNAFLSVLRDAKLPVLYGPKLKPMSGTWHMHFAEQMGQRPEGVILEIGSHLGEVLLKMAADHPTAAFIGMDITMKRVVKVAQKAEAKSLKNITSVLCNARFLDRVVADGELDGIIVFFPDPWAKKKRHHKNRLLQAPFLATLARKLKPGGYFWFKTDWEPYNAEVLEALFAAGWQASTPTAGIPSQVYTSRFERLFKSQGLPTYESIWLPPS
jgi:tRNA (guanine-N7-)-methyltransferase